MASVAHVTSTAWQSSQIPLSSQPRDLEMSPRCQLSGFSHWSDRRTLPCAGVMAMKDNEPAALFLVNSLPYRVAITQSDMTLNQWQLNFSSCRRSRRFSAYSADHSNRSRLNRPP